MNGRDVFCRQVTFYSPQHNFLLSPQTVKHPLSYIKTSLSQVTLVLWNGSLKLHNQPKTHDMAKIKLFFLLVCPFARSLTVKYGIKWQLIWHKQPTTEQDKRSRSSGAEAESNCYLTFNSSLWNTHIHTHMPQLKNPYRSVPDDEEQHEKEGERTKGELRGCFTMFRVSYHVKRPDPSTVKMWCHWQQWRHIWGLIRDI